MKETGPTDELNDFYKAQKSKSQIMEEIKSLSGISDMKYLFASVIIFSVAYFFSDRATVSVLVFIIAIQVLIILGMSSRLLCLEKKFKSLVELVNAKD